MNFTANQELIIRLLAFFSVLLIMLSWEQLAPRRLRTTISGSRRINNLLLICMNTLLLRFLIPLTAASTSVLAAMHGFGLFNNIDTSPWLSGLLSFFLLDLLIYFQHRLFHKVSFLWRLHRVHHSDTEFDVTTGLRFHPLEIILSMCIKVVAIALLGAPVIAVIVFEIILNATSMFNHGNVRIPLLIDSYIRRLLVTPDMHRVHHSAIKRETNSNFGFNLSCWDHLFSTYIDQPVMGHDKITIGLEEFRDHRFINLLWLLKQPFLKSTDGLDNGEL